MKHYLTYGLYLALAGALLNLVFFFLGYHSDVAKFHTAQWVGGIGMLAIGIVLTAVGIKARRADVPPSESFGYGSALGAGVMITLFANLFAAIFNFSYIKFINPGFTDVMMQLQAEKMEAKGMSSAQIEQAQHFMRAMMGPVGYSITGFITGIVFGVIISLVVAAFLRRAASEEPPALA